MPVISYCPGTLAGGFDTYSTTCLKRMYQGKKVSHILPYKSPRVSEEDDGRFRVNRTFIAISGVQEKLSFTLDKNKLRLTGEGKQGTYLVKPIPRDLRKSDQVPANEHLTMQIARQVYGIPTAENALIFFESGEPAYITKRFDVKEDGSKRGKEDFASLAGMTAENAGQDFKYATSYEEMGELLVHFVPAHRIEIEKLFKLIVFNYLFSNGDAHLKNFAVVETQNGDYVLSPAYDLINTRIHVDDADFAPDRGLFRDGYQSNVMQKRGSAGLEDFRELARRFHISENRREKLLEPFLVKQEGVESLIQRSFLSDAVKRGYLLDYETRRNWLRAV